MTNEVAVQEVEESTPVAPAEAKNTEPTTEHMIPKSRLDELNKELKALKQQLDAESKAKRNAEEQRLKEQGEYKTLYDSTVAELEEARSRAKMLEITSIKRDVAQRLSMPIALANRLQGEDEASIEADAKELMAALPKPAAPNINSGTGNGAAPSGSVMSEAEKKEMAARLGVDWRYLP